MTIGALNAGVVLVLTWNTARITLDWYLLLICSKYFITGVLIRPQPDLLSDVFLFDGENILFDASLVIYINNNNIPPIMIINRIYENQNLLSL
jgi:hypothetical protein